jgi:sec-independent protein translocase protein TatA
MFGGIGIQEIVIILIVGLLVFGAARLPKIARSLGQGIKEFKKTVKGIEEDDENEQSSNRYVQQSPQYPQGQQQMAYGQPSQGPNPYTQPPQYGSQDTGMPPGQQPFQGGPQYQSPGQSGQGFQSQENPPEQGNDSQRNT